MADENRKVIKRFYGILKSMDGYLRFVMMTGVSKFTKTSVFSEPNNMVVRRLYYGGTYLWELTLL